MVENMNKISKKIQKIKQETSKASQKRVKSEERNSQHSCRELCPARTNKHYSAKMIETKSPK